MRIKILTVLLALFTFVACDKDNDTTTTNTGNSSYAVKVKIDGKLTEASGVFVYFTKSSDNTNNIYGVFGGKSMYISLDESKGVGTHQLTDIKNYAYYNDGTDGLRSDFGGSGEVTVTSKTDKEMKGTFKFVAKDKINNPTKTVTMTEGEFFVQFR